MPGKRVLAGVVLVLLVAIGVVVWQSGGDDPSRREFANRANEVCREAEQSLENVGRNAESPREIAGAVGRVIEESRSAVDDLEELERPEGDAGETAEEFVNATRREIQEEGIPALEDLREALERGDQEGAEQAAERLQGIDTGESNRAARELGANACAQE